MKGWHDSFYFGNMVVLFERFNRCLQKYNIYIYIYIFILSMWRFKSDHFKYLELKFVYGLKFIEQMCNFAQN